MIPANPTGSRQEGAESEEPRQQGVGQQVFLALADGREVKSSAELVEVNMYDLLNNSVAFICEDKPAGGDSLVPSATNTPAENISNTGCCARLSHSPS